MAFTDQLREAADPIWAAQHEHPFVRGIAEGSLEPRKFRHYIRQDYLFLIDYARLLALGCARAARLDDMGGFARLAEATLGSEMELHRSYAADWGIAGADLEASYPTATTRAYTDYLLRTATLADFGELAAALLPCMWGYHELAAAIADRGRPDVELYARWIDQYAGAEFAELTDWCKALTEAAAEAGDHRRITEAFVTSSRYELAFWDASWREEAPLNQAESGASHAPETHRATLGA
jgi:thiaminase/transcriptional activator TenA